MDELIQAKYVARGDTGASSANIESLGKFNELGTGGIISADKDGYLKPDSRRASTRGKLQALAIL